MSNLSKEEKSLRLKPIRDNFPFFAGISLFFGLLYSFCLYRNPCGITFPLLVTAGCGCCLAVCKKLSVPIKKGSWFLLAIAMLIGISTFLTANPFIHFFNKVALILLCAVFALHQCYNEKHWNLGKYSASILLFFCQALAALPIPLMHAFHYRKEAGSPNYIILLLFALGFIVAMPISLILIVLLSQADAVFYSMVIWCLKPLFFPGPLIVIAFQIAFGALALYCITCCCCLGRIPETVPNRQFIHPAVAAACTGSISLLYLLFCAIQIVYLFLGKGSLPEGYTYSSYARQGFFQLLSVAFFNLAMILFCLKYVRPHPALRLILSVICGCTYILIASAAYRMMLYVGEYHLTRLRILVLWFLALLFVLMAGVTLILWKPKFPLSWFFIATVSIFYVGLSLARPDAIIARDYVSRIEPDSITVLQLKYLSENLSADAAPAVSSLGFSLDELQQRIGTYPGTGWFWTIARHPGPKHHYTYPDSIRTWNYSIGTARQLFGEKANK